MPVLVVAGAGDPSRVRAGSRPASQPVWVRACGFLPKELPYSPLPAPPRLTETWGVCESEGGK